MINIYGNMLHEDGVQEQIKSHTLHGGPYFHDRVPIITRTQVATTLVATKCVYRNTIWLVGVNNICRSRGELWW